MGKKLLIGLTGPAGVGKDTAAGFLVQAFGLRQYAFASPIKDALEAMGFPRKHYDQDLVKDEPIPGIGVSWRRMAQTLGTEWGRSMHPDFWLLLAQRQHDAACMLEEFVGTVVSDVRFENEAAWIRKEGVLIHISGPARREIASDGKGHASERGIQPLPNDLFVTNTGSMTFMFGQLSSLVTHSFGLLN